MSITASGEPLPATAQSGQVLELMAQVSAGRINPEELRAEVVLRRRQQVERVPMQLQADGRHWTAHISLDRSGMYDIGVRLYPFIEGLSSDFEMGLVKWAW